MELELLVQTRISTMPHVAVYQSGNTTSIAGASSGPNAHLGLSLLVFFCINPPFGKFTQTHHSKKVFSAETVFNLLYDGACFFGRHDLWLAMEVLPDVEFKTSKPSLLKVAINIKGHYQFNN